MIDNTNKAGEKSAAGAQAESPGGGSLAGAVLPPGPGGLSQLQALQAYLSGGADAGTTAAVESALADPDSLLMRGLADALGPKPNRD